ncbi:MAG TPA: hypothetical protein EYQ31_01030 [Candidatus Handelsmanbacteria bacterium]|jgi:hypothetical protein|nr:hypothetical protein [Candidatus Latescibacterota bacterium]HIG15982.1 hypothetical protein [Candidatus Handelsmanbacteria bacterium]|tara:strand:+ start:1369 stop:1740 length:372 start_codon:yes stop_codon:yes gene_type:complete
MALTILRTVRPSPTWQDSLIVVSKTQRLVFDVEETWSPDMRDQIAWCGADGIYSHPAGEGYLLPGANVGALIARIGDGPVFAVGSRHDIIADTAGTLMLAMNDHPDHNNQAGKVVAQVILFDA